MHSNSHRLNHDFQLRHFLAGSCHTPDAAWTLLYAQKIDMESKIKHSESQKIDREIKQIEAEELMKSSDRLITLNGKKILAELASSQYIFEMNIEGAMKELEEIEKLMAELEPLCKYSHLSLLERNEACWREEWYMELMRRAENHLLAFGTIPPDQLDTMRQHPDFKEKIVPVILELMQRMQSMPKERIFKELDEGLLMLESSKTYFQS